MATAYPGGLRKRGGLLDYEDTIQAAPRNPFLGGVADLLGQAYKLPEMPRMGVPGLDFVAANRNRLMDLLGVGDVQKTAEAMAYGNRLGTGGGMTYRLLPETMGAAMAVAPFVGKAIRATEGLPVGASTKLIGKSIFDDATKYHQKVPEITSINIGNLKRMNAGEVADVSDEVAAKMDFSKPIQVSVFSNGELRIVDGHHRVAAAKKLGMTSLPVELQAINAKGSTLNQLALDATYPQAEAMRLAQQRAALQVEQGGLGLLESNTAMDRAKAMGFDTPTYHATEADFMSIKPSVKGKIGPGVYTSFDPSYAERYAGGPGAQTMPLLTRGEIAPMDVRSDISDAVQAQLKGENATFDMAKYKTQLNQATANRGYSGYDVDKERLMFDPQDIRSRFAAFDPFRRTAATAAAMGVAAPDLLAAETPEELKRRQMRGLLAP